MSPFRRLDAFKICPLGEGRIYTTPKVTDVRRYLYKAQIFDVDGYDHDHGSVARGFTPGFNLVEIAGGPVKVVCIVNRTGSVEQLKEMEGKRDNIARYFFLHVLVQAIDNLPVTTRTRSNNLALHIARTRVMPEYFRVYKEDLSVLSAAITDAERALPHDAPYRFYFAFIKFGQQMPISPPVNMHSLGLSPIVNKADHVQSCSIHVATTFAHTSPNFSTFWNLCKSTELSAGQDIKKYPLLGLSEIGNFTVKTPTSPRLLNAWHSRVRHNVHLTYTQFYTPFTKPFSNKPFQDHPFLLTLMLGRHYVEHNPTFHSFFTSTEKDSDFIALKEAILLHLSKATSRCEVVVTCPDIRDMSRLDLNSLAGIIRSEALLVQVSCFYSHFPGQKSS